jgi:predicted PurR-regulated permease PerM
MIIVSNLTLYFLCAVIFVFLFYSIYRQVKQADDKNRRLLIKQYLVILVGCIALFIVTSVFFKGPLNEIYYWLSSLVHPKVEYQPIPGSELILPRGTIY